MVVCDIRTPKRVFERRDEDRLELRYRNVSLANESGALALSERIADVHIGTKDPRPGPRSPVEFSLSGPTESPGGRSPGTLGPEKEKKL
jgi:hypothetical protein